MALKQNNNPQTIFLLRLYLVRVGRDCHLGDLSACVQQMVWTGLGGLGGYTGAFRISLGALQRQFFVLFQTWWNCLLAGSPTSLLLSAQDILLALCPAGHPLRWQEALGYLLVGFSLSLGCPGCTFWPSCSIPPLWTFSSNFHGPIYIFFYICVYFVNS